MGNIDNKYAPVIAYLQMRCWLVSDGNIWHTIKFTKIFYPNP